MYFRKFNNFLYDFQYSSNNTDRVITIVKDITKNVRFRTSSFSNVTLYDEYDIRDGDTPEIIAEKIYGSPEYHWVVMLSNQKYDWIKDFPMQQKELYKYVTQKYGSGNEYAIHHYIDSSGYQVDSDNAEATSVSNYAYEDAENEKKRRIKLIAPSLLNQIVREFEDII